MNLITCPMNNSIAPLKIYFQHSHNVFVFERERSDFSNTFASFPFSQLFSPHVLNLTLPSSFVENVPEEEKAREKTLKQGISDKRPINC